LELSEKKTKILKIRGPGEGEKIGRFKVEKETRYLGIQVGGRGRNIFEAENKIWIQKAEKKANVIISQIKKSADKVIVGKAIWKLMAIPAILFGRAVVTMTKGNIEKLQRIENKVWRYLLGIGGYSSGGIERRDRSLNGEIQDNGNYASLYDRHTSRRLHKYEGNDEGYPGKEERQMVQCYRRI